MVKKRKPKIGAYLRVSTSDKQTTKSQRHSIREWSKSNHVNASEIRWFEDKKSGATTDRPQLTRIMRAVDRGTIDCLVVYSLSRLARNLRQGLELLSDLGQRGIRVVSVSEQIDFGSTTGQLIASILLAVAEFEREVIRERIIAGLAATDKPIGRPRNHKKLASIRKMRLSGMSVQEISEKIHCSRTNVYRALEKTAGIEDGNGESK